MAQTPNTPHPDDDADENNPTTVLPGESKNYITPQGYQRLRDELTQLVRVERPEVVSVVSWAASNGDRSENGDYLYGKKRLREIDRRIRFLSKRLDLAHVVYPEQQQELSAVFFGAEVTYLNGQGQEVVVRIVGTDEVDTSRGYISWVSPVARALLKASEGDVVLLNTPIGQEELEVIKVEYKV